MVSCILKSPGITESNQQIYIMVFQNHLRRRPPAMYYSFHGMCTRMFICLVAYGYVTLEGKIILYRASHKVAPLGMLPISQKRQRSWGFVLDPLTLDSLILFCIVLIVTLSIHHCKWCQTYMVKIYVVTNLFGSPSLRRLTDNFATGSGRPQVYIVSRAMP